LAAAVLASDWSFFNWRPLGSIIVFVTVVASARTWYLHPRTRAAREGRRGRSRHHQDEPA
jgi:hypothetical protein